MQVYVKRCKSFLYWSLKQFPQHSYSDSVYSMIKTTSHGYSCIQKSFRFPQQTLSLQHFNSSPITSFHFSFSPITTGMSMFKDPPEKKKRSTVQLRRNLNITPRSGHLQMSALDQGNSRFPYQLERLHNHLSVSPRSLRTASRWGIEVSHGIVSEITYRNTADEKL